MEVNVSPTSSFRKLHNQTLLLCNARSVRKKWSNFKLEADLFRPNILAITETWLSDDVCNSYAYYNYKQFTVNRNALVTDNPGGGVMLLFHPAYSVFQTTVPVAPPISCEALAIVDANDRHCWVLVYLPDSRSAAVVSQLCAYLDYILSKHKSATIMGDFNMRDVKWDKCYERQHLSESQRKFRHFCDSWDLHQIVESATRGCNYLDIILTTHPERYGKVVVHSPINSDHSTVLCQLRVPLHERQQPVRFEKNFVQADYKAIAYHLSLCNWQAIFSGSLSVNQYWTTLYRLLSELVL